MYGATAPIYTARQRSYYSAQSLRFTPQGGGGRCGAYTASLRCLGFLSLQTTRCARFRLRVWALRLVVMPGGRVSLVAVGVLWLEVRCGLSVCCLWCLWFVGGVGAFVWSCWVSALFVRCLWSLGVGGG